MKMQGRTAMQTVMMAAIPMAETPMTHQTAVTLQQTVVTLQPMVVTLPPAMMMPMQTQIWMG
jgi:hypothetical protein